MWIATKSTLIYICTLLNLKHATSTNDTRAEIIATIFKNYNKYNMPPQKDDGPHTVLVSVNIHSIFDISEKDSSFKVRYYLGLGWKDTRLEFSHLNDKNNTQHITIHNTIQLPVDVFRHKGDTFYLFISIILTILSKTLLTKVQVFMLEQMYFALFQHLYGMFSCPMKKIHQVLLQVTFPFLTVDVTYILMGTYTSVEN